MVSLMTGTCVVTTDGKFGGPNIPPNPGLLGSIIYKCYSGLNLY